MICNWLRKLFAASPTKKIMQRLDVKDGDIVLVSISRKLSVNEWRNMRDNIQGEIGRCGYNVNVFLLDEGMEIAGVLTKTAEITAGSNLTAKRCPLVL